MVTAEETSLKEDYKDFETSVKIDYTNTIRGIMLAILLCVLVGFLSYQIGYGNGYDYGYSDRPIEVIQIDGVAINSGDGWINFVVTSGNKTFSVVSKNAFFER